MLSVPSCTRIIEVVRHELRTAVAAAVDDGAVKTKLAMLDVLLGTVAVRCGSEIAWVLDEVAAIEQLAREFLAETADVDGSVAIAYAEWQRHQHASARWEDIQREYEFASRLLACLLEVGIRRGGELRQRCEAVLNARTARERQILGELSLVGRT